PKPPSHPSNPWTPTFTNGTCAVQADDYLTYGLVDTVDDCETMCTGVDGCVFFNTYHDNNAKDGSTQLTCALFSKCHDQKDADNCGGQTEPDGSINFITESAGYCKK
ncbi:fruit-body specific protein A, partial [Hymenopellis radicata]